MTKNTFYDIVGIGNAIVDVLAKVGDGFLNERNLKKNSMTLVEAKDAGAIYNDIVPEREVSGGSAANTIAALASLGGTPAFIGKIHDDELGQTFKRDIGAAGVDFFTKPLTEGPSTGRSIVLVTPEADRSMFTYTGAAARLTEDDIDIETIKSAKMVYIEGYLWEEGETSRKAILKACEVAKANNKEVALSLSDKSCVEKFRDDFLSLIKSHVDLLFSNEEELTTLYQEPDIFKALDLIKNDCEISAITRSEKGSVVVHRKTKIFVEAEKVANVIDSTGAGDLYAAGFLYGYTTERSLSTCAIIGGITASEIITHYGARPEVSLRGFVRNKLAEYGKIV